MLSYNQECIGIEGKYKCNVSDEGGYIFSRCTKLYITTAKSYEHMSNNDIYHDQYFVNTIEPSRDLNNLRFVYEKDGKLIEEVITNPKFVPAVFSLGYFMFVCEINRPTTLVPTKGESTKIEIHFESELDLKSVEFHVESCHEDTYNYRCIIL